jgi:hypothetical protein
VLLAVRYNELQQLQTSIAQSEWFSHRYQTQAQTQIFVEAMLFYITQINDFNNNNNNNKTAYCSRMYHDTNSSVLP